MGIEISHLLTASVISAPAGLLIAKVMVPEKARRVVTSSAEGISATTNPDPTAVAEPPQPIEMPGSRTI